MVAVELTFFIEAFRKKQWFVFVRLGSCIEVKEELQSYTTFLKGYHHDLNAILGELNDNGKTVSMPSVFLYSDGLIL